MRNSRHDTYSMFSWIRQERQLDPDEREPFTKTKPLNFLQLKDAFANRVPRSGKRLLTCSC